MGRFFSLECEVVNELSLVFLRDVTSELGSTGRSNWVENSGTSSGLGEVVLVLDIVLNGHTGSAIIPHVDGIPLFVRVLVGEVWLTNGSVQSMVEAQPLIRLVNVAVSF